VGWVRRFLRWFGPKRCRRIKVVVTDIHDPYTSVLKKALPKAALVYDHFHVSNVVHDALDEIRRRIQRQLPPTNRRIIKGQRYVLLRARENLSDKQRVSLQEVLALNTDLTAGHILKEAFREVFKAKDVKDGRKRLNEGERQVRESGVPELIHVLKRLRWSISAGQLLCMDKFIELHAGKISESLSCFDRVLFRGYLTAAVSKYHLRPRRWPVW
jgi:transposase